MTTMFDTATLSFNQYLDLVFPGVALVVTVLIAMRGGGRKWIIIMSGVTVLLFLLAFVLPVADFHHVRAALDDGSAKTTEGVISQHERKTIRRFMGSSQGVGVTSTSRYSTTVTELFYVGSQWFWLRVAGYPSNASFTNAGDPPLPLADGTKVRVTWFNDPWNGDETRILKLEIDEQSAARATARAATALPGQPAPAAAIAAVGAAKADLPADFAGFWSRFAAAAAKGDREGVKTLTRFPFLFAGTPLGPDRFDSIWMGIFPTPLRACFETAVPVPDGAAWSASCGAYVYLFEKDAGGWKLASFTADPEALE